MKGRAVRRARVGAFSKAEGLAAAPVTRSQLPLPRPAAGPEQAPGAAPAHCPTTQRAPKRGRVHSAAQGIVLPACFRQTSSNKIPPRPGAEDRLRPARV